MQNQLNLSNCSITKNFILNDSDIGKNYWTNEEVEKLKKDISNGKKIKNIAFELGRSHTAVNKYISRLGLTTRQNTKNVNSKKITRKKKDFSLPEHIRNKVYGNEQVVDFSKVILYMRLIGYKVSKNNSFQSIFYTDEEYKLNNKPISKIRLLLLANRLRAENNLPIFKTSELEW